MSSVKTPCVGICSTVFGDEVCRGCKRFVHEVIDWNSYNDEQKLLVKERLEKLSTQVLASKLRIVDERLFGQSLSLADIPLSLSSTMQILELLRKASKQMHNLRDHGLEALPEYRAYRPHELRELLDAEIHVLSTATYHKNFKPTYLDSLQVQGTQGQGQKQQPDRAGIRIPPSMNDSEVQIQ